MANIVLVGMPAAGKTTIGKQLANMLSLQFVDTDKTLTETLLISVPEIFKHFGEAWFRNRETELLRKLLQKTGQVISTGGGLPCFNGNMELIANQSVSIFIDIPKDIILTRIARNSNSRPMFTGKSETEIAKLLEEMYAKRLEFYEKAHYRFTSATELLTSIPNIIKLNHD